MNQFKRAMVVVAHPDDAEFGCSGTVARWSSSGVEVTYVLCTDGSKGSDEPKMTSGRLAVIRKREQQAAAVRVGAALGRRLARPAPDSSEARRPAPPAPPPPCRAPAPAAG